MDYDANKPVNDELIEAFKSHMIHGPLAVCATMRPSVDISLTE